MPSIPLVDQVVRLLRRKLTPDEAAGLARAESQGYSVAGRHHGDFRADLPPVFDETGERAALHIDPTPLGGQSAYRKSWDPNDGRSTEVVVSRLKNPVQLTDEKVNNFASGEKAALQAKGSTGAYYPNVAEVSPNKAGDAFKTLGISELGLSSPQFNPSLAMFDPGDVRKFNARFDPKMVGKPGWMAGVGAGSVMSQPSNPEPKIDEDLPLESVGITGPEMISEMLSPVLNFLRRK
jgi:hypothetical protein